MNDYRDIIPYKYKGTKRDEKQTEFMESWNNAIISEKSRIIHAPTGIGKTVCSLAPAIYNIIKNKNKHIIILVSRLFQHKAFIKELKKISNKLSYNDRLIVADCVGRDNLCFISKKEREEKNIKNINEYCNDCKIEKRQYNGICCVYRSKIHDYEHIKYLKDKKQNYDDYDFSDEPEYDGYRMINELLKKLKEDIILYSDTKKECKSKDKDICPYELLSLHMKYSDIIIMDYNIILNPYVRKTVFKNKLNGISLNDVILIADEAHNIPDIARKILTRKINTSIFCKGDLSIKSAAWESKKYIDEKIQKGVLDDTLKKLQEKLICIDLKKLTGSFSKIKVNIDKKIDELIKKSEYDKESKIKDKIEITNIFESEFSNSMDNIIKDFEKIVLFLESMFEKDEDDKKEYYISTICRFFKRFNEIDEKDYLLSCSTEFDKKYNKHIKNINCSCLNPKECTDVFNKTHNTIIMSGTLKPTDMFKKVLGLDNTFKELEITSPFPSENRLNIISNFACSRGKPNCTEKKENAKRYAEIIFRLLDKIPKNVGIFFGSFSYMKDIYAVFENILDEKKINRSNFKRIMVEKRAKEWKSGERERFIDDFKKESGTDYGAVLFGVVRANCSEGVDYPGDNMRATIIIGVPYPVRSVLQDGLNKKYGWENGYLNPTMNVISQAAGRCIRSDKDRGVVMYIDSRYNELKFEKHLSDCKVYKKEETEDMLLKIKEFYSKI